LGHVSSDMDSQNMALMQDSPCTFQLGHVSSDMDSAQFAFGNPVRFELFQLGHVSSDMDRITLPAAWTKQHKFQLGHVSSDMDR